MDKYLEDKCDINDNARTDREIEILKKMANSMSKYTTTKENIPTKV